MASKQEQGIVQADYGQERMRNQFKTLGPMNDPSGQSMGPFYTQEGFREKYLGSLLEVLVMLACAIILIVLVSTIVFIAVQGGRYFAPMSAFQVTTFIQHDLNTANASIIVDDSTKADNTKKDRSTKQTDSTSIEYMLSHESQETLTNSITQKLDNQFIDTGSRNITVVVASADDLFLLSTVSGQKFLGEFDSLQNGETEMDNLSQLTPMKSTVASLQQNLNDIQISRLTPLHREINDLNVKQVSQDTELYQRKLAEFYQWQSHANTIKQQIESYRINLRLDTNEVISIGVLNMQEFYQPNKLNWWESLGYSVEQIYIFLSDSPKQASTSGGVFPAIFGTILMVIIMAIVVTPFGAISAIYLHEYAPANRLTEIIRISVSNMAAVPSVVYGVFGLGFFVYVLGGSIDSLLYSDNLPSPTFGTPGLLWAALTMGILTLPVVIVSTEEGLSRVPKNLRAGALALGATKYETIKKVVLPMASPGILSGVILAIARAAGEVAPLILVGAVKFAPTLPIDGEFPYVHFERQFMHLGVFIYDGAFHNQTETQVSSLMFASCMLLLIIVFLLNISAIIIRKRLRDKYERL